MTVLLQQARGILDPFVSKNTDLTSAGHVPTSKVISAPAGLPASPERKGVADDYMYEFEYPVELPTIDKYDVKLDDSSDARSIATAWLDAFTEAAEHSDGEKFTSLFLVDGGFR
jgi:hypothetical protein